MYQGRTAFYDLAQLLVTSIDAALLETEYGSVDRVCVVPGELAWDECECGTLATSPQRFFLSDEFPQDALGRGLVRTSPCDLPFLVGEISIAVVRCAPQPRGTALAPACVDLAAASQVLLSDAYVALTETVRVLCELKADELIVDYALGEQVTRGPEGSCVGTELLAFVALLR